MIRIEAQHRRQDNGVQRAVMQHRFPEPAERMRHRVHRAQPLLERQPALQRGHHHVPARLPVGAVRDRRTDPAGGAARTVQRDGVGRHVVARRQEGFDAMRQRIHPGGGGQPGRQPQRQFRIADRHPGNHVGRDEGELAAVTQGDQGSPADLTAGPGRRRHRGERCDGGRDLRQPPENRGVLLQRAVMVRHQRDTLGEIDR